MKQYSFYEVAGIIGVTKNTIKSRAKKLPPEMLIREDGVLYVDETGLNWFKKNIKNHPVNQKKATSETINVVDTAPADAEPVKDQTDLVDELRRTIALLSDQIEKKDHQIEELNTSLKREQEISLHNSLLLKEREEQIIRLEADTKKSWFSRHFGRKNSTKQLN